MDGCTAATKSSRDSDVRSALNRHRLVSLPPSCPIRSPIRILQAGHHIVRISITYQRAGVYHWRRDLPGGKSFKSEWLPGSCNRSLSNEEAHVFSVGLSLFFGTDWSLTVCRVLRSSAAAASRLTRCRLASQQMIPALGRDKPIGTSPENANDCLCKRVCYGTMETSASLLCMLEGREGRRRKTMRRTMYLTTVWTGCWDEESGRRQTVDTAHLAIA